MRPDDLALVATSSETSRAKRPREPRDRDRRDRSRRRGARRTAPAEAPADDHLDERPPRLPRGSRPCRATRPSRSTVTRSVISRTSSQVVRDEEDARPRARDLADDREELVAGRSRAGTPSARRAPAGPYSEPSGAVSRGSPRRRGRSRAAPGRSGRQLGDLRARVDPRARTRRTSRARAAARASTTPASCGSA